MKITKITDYHRGWFVGNFEPSMFNTDQFEVGVLQHKKGEEWPCHYHTGHEINYLLSGKMVIQDTIITSGDVFMFEPYEIANPKFLEDCTVVVVKTPSKPGDKYTAQCPE